MEVGAIAVALLGIVYIFIANIGATSVERFGLFDTGAPVLTASGGLPLWGNWSNYFGYHRSISLLEYKYWSYYFL